MVEGTCRISSAVLLRGVLLATEGGLYGEFLGFSSEDIRSPGSHRAAPRLAVTPASAFSSSEVSGRFTTLFPRPARLAVAALFSIRPTFMRVFGISNAFPARFFDRGACFGLAISNCSPVAAESDVFWLLVTNGSLLTEVGRPVAVLARGEMIRPR